MKTIEERADAYVGHPEEIDEFTSETIKREAYIRGAKEQKAIDIEKACEWLDNYLMEIGYPDDWMRDSPNMKSGEERFRNAMEKQL